MEEHRRMLAERNQRALDRALAPPFVKVRIGQIGILSEIPLSTVVQLSSFLSMIKEFSLL
jgi:hypothetical protein